MPRPRNAHPTVAELEILRVLWDRGPSTVRDVYEALPRHDRVGYTTVLKTVQIMMEKKLVQRDDSAGRSHVFRAMAAEETTQRQLVEDLVDRVFGGSAAQLVVQALSSKSATPEELRLIRETLDRNKRGDQ